MTKLVEILHDINCNTLISQEMDIRLYIILIQWLTACYPRETREIFHKFHPLVQIFYTIVCIQFIPAQYLWQSTTSMSLRFSASSYL